MKLKRLKSFSSKALRHEIALCGHLAVHHVARLIMVRMRQAVGLQVIVVALSVPRNDAINIMY